MIKTQHIGLEPEKSRRLFWLILWLILGTPALSWGQSISINSDGSAPDSSAMLDVSSTTSGFLAPRMTQSERNAISNPATGLMIYQTDNVPGFRVYNGISWTTPGNGFRWNITGNSGTDPSTSFLGTTDAQDLVFRTNNTQRMRIASSGNVGIGAIDSSSLLYIESSTDTALATIRATGSTDWSALRLQNDQGSIGYIGTVGSNFVTTAWRNRLVMATEGSLGEGININSTTGDIQFETNNGSAHAFSMSSDGHFGVGIDSGNYEFHLHEPAGVQTVMQMTTSSSGSGTSDGFRLTTSGDSVAIINQENGTMSLGTANNVSLSLRSNGRVGVGNPVPDSLLDVAGGATIDRLNINSSYTFPSTIGTNGQVLQINSGVLDWTSVSTDTLSILEDTDNDTRIQLEEGGDDDTIRFDMNGTEHFRMGVGRLEVVNTGRSVFIGHEAGKNDDLTNNENVFIGDSAGRANTTGTINTFIGVGSGKSADSDQNTAIGYQTMRDLTGGFANVAVGDLAMISGNGSGNVILGSEAFSYGTGNENVAVGSGALGSSSSQAGNRNIAIGLQTGFSNAGSDNVLIGYQVGAYSTFSNELHIGTNSAGDNPLIWGDFAGDSVSIFGLLTVDAAGSGDAQLVLEADEDNNNENDNPSILLTQDGGSNTGLIALEGGGGTTISESTDNALIVGTPVNEDVHFFTNNITRMTIEGGGSVGIGTSEPSGDFMITDSTGGAELRVNTENAGSTSNLYLTNTLHEYRLVNDVDGKLRFQDETASASRMVIDSFGNVGVGTLSPDSLFDVAGGADINRLSINEAYSFPTSAGTSGQVLTAGSGGTVAWANAGGTSLVDSDADTRIELQEGSKDTIRFELDGTEQFRMVGSRLEFANSSSLFIGDSAGYNDGLGNFENLYIGRSAGRVNNSATGNLAIGDRALEDNTGGFNLAIGANALQKNSTSSGNMAIGYDALDEISAGAGNTAIGAFTLANITSGLDNLALGTSTVPLVTSGDSNIVIGNVTGTSLTTATGNILIGHGIADDGTTTLTDKLIIESGKASNPLIWGDFANDSVKIYGALGVGDAFVLPTADGTSGQYLTTNGSGVTSWSSLTSLTDADSDTRIQLKEASVDTISFELDGIEQFRMVSSRLEFANSSILFIGDSAGYGNSGTSNQNLYIGRSAGRDGFTNIQNTAIGDRTLMNSSGSFNTAIGTRALTNNTSGSANTALGAEALLSLSATSGSGSNNVALGNAALQGMTSGTHNIAIGSAPLPVMTSGDSNIAIGTLVNTSMASGSGNIFIGNGVAEGNTSLSHELWIENSSSSTPLIWGDFSQDLVQINGNLTATNGLLVSSGRVGIGTTSPGTDVEIAQDSMVLRTPSNFSGTYMAIAGSRHNNGASYATLDFRNLDSTDGNTEYSGGRIESHNALSSDDGDLRFFTTSDQTSALAMILDEEGNMGIGTTDPQGMLHLSGTAPASSGSRYGLRSEVDDGGNGSSTIYGIYSSLDNAGGGSNTYYGLYSNVNITTGSNTSIGLYSFGAEYAAIFDGGNVGVLNNAPSSALDVAGDIETGDANAFYFGDPGTNGTWRIIRDGDDLSFERRESGSWVFKMKINP